MKNLIWFLPLLVLAASCSKKDTGINTPPGTVTFKIDTATYTTQDYDASYYINPITDTTVEYTFNGTLKADGPKGLNKVGIALKGNYYALPAIYRVGLANPFDIKLTPSYYIGSSIYAGTRGTVVITQLDTVKARIWGTFQFTAVNLQSPYDSVVITNGRMDSVVYEF